MPADVLNEQLQISIRLTQYMKRMKNSGRYTFALLVTLVATSFTSPMVEDKATGFTETNIDSAYFGNYRITEHHQLGKDRFITDDGKAAMLISN